MSGAVFEGMVVNPGSPNDGKRKASKTPFLRMDETPVEGLAGAVARVSSKAAPKKEVRKIGEYVFVRMNHGSGAEWGFWVPDGRDGAWAMDTVVQAYRRSRK